MSTSGTYEIDKADEKRFRWRSYPHVQTFLEQRLSDFLAPVQRRQLSSDPLWETVVLRDTADACGLRFFDLLDYLRLAVPADAKALLEKQGFTPREKIHGMGRLYRHEGALFPFLILEEVQTEKASAVLELAIKVEDLELLQKRKGYPASLREGREPSLRSISLSDQRGYALTFVERRGNSGFEKRDGEKESSKKVEEVEFLFGKFRDTKIRCLEDPEEAFKKTFEIVEKAIILVGKERAAYEWVQAEVRYWEQRNKAATVQGKLQRELGLGWLNKDHITYRNSKKNFPKTIKVLSLLGFEKRERLHAEEFTAQILENPVLGVAAFVDVDPAGKKELGTVGLWVKIHGESLLSAGLHHMAARYDFVKVQGVLKKHGVSFRPPFSYFDDLKQVFTEGERSVIPEAHARRLLAERVITEPQFREYVTKGAVYTHLEDIQRGNGFKGFNQQSVDKTLRDTGKSLRFKK